MIRVTQAILFLAFVLGVVSAPPASAQSEPEPPKNLQYFPKEVDRKELIGYMRDFSFALGVACTHCHGTAEQTGFRLEGVDFSLDVKPAKEKARAMLRMTEQINSKLLAEIPTSKLDLKVSCFTCHSGLPLPESIEGRMLRILEAEGVEAAVEDYRATREQYYGSAAYNFKEQPLVEVAADLHGAGKYKAAVAISQLNLEFHGDSGQSKFRLAEAHFALGEVDKARKLYEEILADRPRDERVRARLEELGKVEQSEGGT